MSGTNNSHIFSILILAALLVGCRVNTGFEKDRYLGQKPPGTRGEVFAPGVVSTPDNLEIGTTWSPDGKEFYFIRQSESGGKMFCVEYTKEGWSDPFEVEHFINYPGFEPFISPDGRQFFYTRITEPPSDPAENFSPVNIWVMDKKGKKFGAPHLVVPGMYSSVAENGNLYVTHTTGETRGIFMYRYGKEGYEAPEFLGGGVNSPVMGAHPCIAPDERFIVFDSKRSEDPEDTDLFICFRQKDGSWSKAVSLGPTVNTRWNDICASLSPDGRYLFYMSKADIYWVSTSVFDELLQTKQDTVFPGNS